MQDFQSSLFRFSYFDQKESALVLSRLCKSSNSDSNSSISISSNNSDKRNSNNSNNSSSNSNSKNGFRCKSVNAVQLKINFSFGLQGLQFMSWGSEEKISFATFIYFLSFVFTQSVSLGAPEIYQNLPDKIEVVLPSLLLTCFKWTNSLKYFINKVKQTFYLLEDSKEGLGAFVQMSPNFPIKPSRMPYVPKVRFVLKAFLPQTN